MTDILAAAGREVKLATALAVYIAVSVNLKM
jgi:hypothetical protein